MDLKLEHFDFVRDLEKQRELFADAFSEVQNKSVELYNWQFHQFPNILNRSFEFCSFIEDEMVGYYAAIPYQYKIIDTITDVGMVCGVMTSSKHRGKGIFTKMGKYSTEELASSVPFTTGYPIRKSVIPGHLKVGWKIAFELPLYMKFIRSNSLLKTKGIKLLSLIVNPLLSVFNYFRKTQSKLKYEADFYSEIGNIIGYDHFASQWSKSVPNALLKDLSFAKWRYGCPGKKYSFLVIKNNNQIVGLASYCSIIKEGVPSYCLLDLMVLPDCKQQRENIIEELDGVEVIMFMMSKHSAKQYKIVENGFLKSPYKFYFIIKNLTNKYTDEVLLKEENWHLMWVDSDDL